jgi:hypothetical protein
MDFKEYSGASPKQLGKHCIILQPSKDVLSYTPEELKKKIFMAFTSAIPNVEFSGHAKWHVLDDIYIWYVKYEDEIWPILLQKDYKTADVYEVIQMPTLMNDREREKSELQKSADFLIMKGEIAKNEMGIKPILYDNKVCKGRYNGKWNCFDVEREKEKRKTQFFSMAKKDFIGTLISDFSNEAQSLSPYQ